MKTKNQKIVKNDFQSGFTLLELLVVIVILGILVTIGLGTFLSSQVKSRDAKRKNDLEQIAKALEMYHSDHGHYPVNNDSGQIRAWFDDDGEDVAADYEWGDKFDDPAQPLTIYMSVLPQDSSSGKRYYYQAYHADFSDADGFDAHSTAGSDHQAEAYKLYAQLENANDSSIVSGGIADTDCGTDPVETSLCNYYLTSQNITLDQGD
ncbi:MAG: prepilin-type N-terminal cleavage/methylation domain-containing protein [Candidatus Pacebacteria bacterium]|nr:prepilin-type N-terminal cleavage/methylation domain-containing protein [Candidatus Paceibacterota bacterium]